MRHRADMQSCIDEGLECLKRESASYDYIYTAIHTPTYNCKPVETSNRTTRGLIAVLENKQEYLAVYRSEEVVIFEKK